jgi:hypothetical protein
MPSSELLLDNEQCGHPGCLCHVSHPCEGCGRVAGKIEVAVDPGSAYVDSCVVVCSQCHKSLKIPHGEYPPLVGWCGCDNNARVGA